MPSNAIKHEDIDRNSTGVLLSSHRREKSDPPATLLTLRLPVFIPGWCGIAELSCPRHGKRTFDYRSRRDSNISGIGVRRFTLRQPCCERKRPRPSHRTLTWIRAWKIAF